MSFQRTNIEIDADKVKVARRMTGLKTTKDVVDFALSRLSQTSKALEGIFSLSGKVRFHKNYSCKKSR